MKERLALDNITFKKIYEDDHLFQLRVTASNDRITMLSNVYAGSDILSKWCSGVKKLLQKPFTFVMGNDDDSYLDCVKLSFSTNNRGVVAISIYMKTTVDHRINDTANFVVYSDVASLDRFTKAISYIINSEVGTSISLHE